MLARWLYPFGVGGERLVSSHAAAPEGVTEPRATPVCVTDMSLWEPQLGSGYHPFVYGAYLYSLCYSTKEDPSHSGAQHTWPV